MSTEAMSDERLVEIREEATEGLWRGSVKRAAEDVLELLAEVDRMRVLEVPSGIEIDPSKITPELIAKWQTAWDEMLATGVTMYDLTPQPRDADRTPEPLDIAPLQMPPYPPLRDRIPRRFEPRSNDRAAGG